MQSGGIEVYADGWMFSCWVCGESGHLGGFSGPPPETPIPRMRLARHVLPCPACGAGTPPPPPKPDWPKGKRRPLP
jgi:hypothetical protein